MSGDSVAQDQIRAFVDRILRLKEEAKDINRDIREIYAEAKGNGFDKTILGKLVSYVEKRAAGATDPAEAEALFDLYLSAYDGVGTNVATHTHETKSTAARKDAPFEAMHDASPDFAQARGKTSAEAATKLGVGTQAPPVDTNSETPVSHAPVQPGREEPGTLDGAASTGETAQNIEPEAAMLSQTEPVSGARSAPAEQASVESSASLPIATSVLPPTAGANDDRGGADSSPVSASVVSLHRHNPDTHFLNSKGLPRLHGCLNGENCAGSWSKLCFTCSTQHEGPAYSDGAA